MNKLFQFETLEVDLLFNTKSVVIQLNRPEKRNAINLLMIKELDQVLSWCSKHIEIHSILMKGHNEFFSQGIDLEELKSYTDVELKQFFTIAQNVVYGMLHLPQTIILDASKQCSNLAAELMLGADIRIAHENCVVEFDHLNKGLIPQSGGLSLLGQFIGITQAKNWILTGMEIPSEQLINAGLIQEFYSDHDIETDYLQIVARQAPLSRIQTKAALLEINKLFFEKSLQVETSYSLGPLVAGDWKNDQFTNPIEFFGKMKQMGN